MYQFSIAFFQFLMVRSGCSSISNMPTILSKVTDLPPEIQTTITKKALASLAKDQMTQFEAVFHRRHGDQDASGFIVAICSKKLHLTSKGVVEYHPRIFEIIPLLHSMYTTLSSMTFFGMISSRSFRLQTTIGIATDQSGMRVRSVHRGISLIRSTMPELGESSELGTSP
ncbi:hypothetical protein SLEP1_g58719 [Rubroshorea leprosula]|uniref:Uncharacterized protein n=1 Tax=Rubroshorea leprosula TaxID=152421 RepID=A0AAV5MQA2_9ROSI|nr:hypothetical protein SLEP1_g58719 [Rubroshorea leprosula]